MSTCPLMQPSPWPRRRLPAWPPTATARRPPEVTDAADGTAVPAIPDEQVGTDREPSVALSVAGAARGLGVAPGTLRSWERRYGLAPSLHTPGGHRRYGPIDLARLGVMHRLVQEGVPPAEAARAAIHTQIGAEAVDASNPYAALLGSPGAEASSTPAVGGADDPAPGQRSSRRRSGAAHAPQPSVGARPGPGGDVPGLPRLPAHRDGVPGRPGRHRDLGGADPPGPGRRRRALGADQPRGGDRALLLDGGGRGAGGPLRTPRAAPQRPTRPSWPARPRSCTTCP